MSNARSANRPQRKSIRLPEYDYSHPGVYFVTICLQMRRCLLGEIVEEKVLRSEAGRMAHAWWLRIPSKFQTVELDQFVAMPNHIHGLLVFPQEYASDHPTLSQVIQWYKTMTTNAYIKGVREHGWPRYHRRLWHRNYYERIVRDEEEWGWLRLYIDENPRLWAKDPENPRRPAR